MRPGQADLVDVDRRHRHRDARLDRRLAARHLALAGHQHLAHDDVVDLVGRHAGPLEGGGDGGAAEVGGGQRGERAGHLPDRGAGAGDDVGTWHGPRLVQRFPRQLLPVGNISPMQQILEAIQAGASGDELADLPLPDHYRAAFVRREDAEMFAGMESADKDPTKSLHIGDVATPELAPDEAYVAVMASSINFNTVWTSIFEPLPTFGFLDRYARESDVGGPPRACRTTSSAPTPPASCCASARRCATGSPATGSRSTATPSTTRTRRPTTTRCSPPTSGSGASRPTSAGSPTSPSSRPTS